MPGFSYTGVMKSVSLHSPLDIQALALAGVQTGGTVDIRDFARVAQACAGGEPLGAVQWQARAECRSSVSGEPQTWLHLDADCVVPLTCQRCLDTAQIRLRVDRWFRFVPDEASAVAQDDDCEEDLLVQDAGFTLAALLEDELVLELPHIARHDSCPTQNLTDARPEPRPHPFASLAGYKSGRSGS